MIITKEWLERNGACEGGKQWFASQTKTDLHEVVKALIHGTKFDWANWALTRAMTYKQRVQYAAYSAKQSLYVFEKVYPGDKRPRSAASAALRWVKDPTEVNRSAAESAARSAQSAARSAQSAAWSAQSAAQSAAPSAQSAARSAQSAWSAAWSAESAWSAAWSAAESAARSAAWSAWSAAGSAWSAAGSAGSAESAESAESAAWKRILKYGMRLAKENS